MQPLSSSHLLVTYMLGGSEVKGEECGSEVKVEECCSEVKGHAEYVQEGVLMVLSVGGKEGCEVVRWVKGEGVVCDMCCVKVGDSGGGVREVLVTVTTKGELCLLDAQSLNVSECVSSLVSVCHHE